MDKYIFLALSVALALLLLILLIVSVLCFRKGMSSIWRSMRKMFSFHGDVLDSNFATFYTTMCRHDNERIKEEYEDIETYSLLLNKSTKVASRNGPCNRYSNIHPFDYNRVVLNDVQYGNDYINASYIDGYVMKREYIAAQGPKSDTAHDFWRMICQDSVEIIVMLTPFFEDGRGKCHQYFPDLDKELSFDDIEITCRSEEKHEKFVKKILDVKKLGAKCTVKHYYFNSWSDCGVPSSETALIEFSKIVQNDRQNPKAPIVVHCSAGVGRTGTFIALDIMVQRIKNENKFNVYKLVKHLRSQRMMMVQTVEQYIYLYTSALELSKKLKDTTG